MLLVDDHLSILSAQYLVHCLDTENVCHQITTLDYPPREMKESLFTRHNQTVLPLLANTKKPLQAIHTSCINITIDNMTSNIVLNHRTPPINDEETYLTKRQRDTVTSMLQPLQDLELLQKRLKHTCGMDPQDVPHLFNITAHTTALTPENLWNRPVKTIQELSFLDPENLE